MGNSKYNKTESSQDMQSKIWTYIPLYNTLKKSISYRIFNKRTIVSLSFKIFGDNSPELDKSPIILFHGLIENKRHWKNVAKIMMNTMKRSVVTVDLRNHGDSPHAQPHKYKDMAADILKLFEKLNIDRACLVGYSMGGKAAMCLSLLAPEKVSALIVVEVSPISTPKVFVEDMPKFMAAMKTVDFTNTKTIVNARKRAKDQLKGIVRDESVLAVIISNIIIKPDNTIGWTCNVNLLIKHFKHIISFPKSLDGNKYYGPTLFIGGHRSDFIPPGDASGIQAYFPHAMMQYIPNTGHNVQKDDPKRFLEMVIAFLRNTP